MFGISTPGLYSPSNIQPNIQSISKARKVKQEPTPLLPRISVQLLSKIQVTEKSTAFLIHHSILYPLPKAGPLTQISLLSAT